VRLAPHPEPLEHARGRRVAGVEAAADPVHPELLEADAQQGARASVA